MAEAEESRLGDMEAKLGEGIALPDAVPPPPFIVGVTQALKVAPADALPPPAAGLLVMVEEAVPAAEVGEGGEDRVESPPTPFRIKGEEVPVKVRGGVTLVDRVAEEEMVEVGEVDPVSREDTVPPPPPMPPLKVGVEEREMVAEEEDDPPRPPSPATPPPLEGLVEGENGEEALGVKEGLPVGLDAYEGVIRGENVPLDESVESRARLGVRVGVNTPEPLLKGVGVAVKVMGAVAVERAGGEGVVVMHADALWDTPEDALPSPPPPPLAPAKVGEGEVEWVGEGVPNKDAEKEGDVVFQGPLGVEDPAEFTGEPLDDEVGVGIEERERREEVEGRGGEGVGDPDPSFLELLGEGVEERDIKAVAVPPPFSPLPPPPNPKEGEDVGVWERVGRLGVSVAREDRVGEMGEIVTSGVEDPVGPAEVLEIGDDERVGSNADGVVSALSVGGTGVKVEGLVRLGSKGDTV